MMRRGMAAPVGAKYQYVLPARSEPVEVRRGFVSSVSSRFGGENIPASQCRRQGSLRDFHFCQMDLMGDDMQILMGFVWI